MVDIIIPAYNAHKTIIKTLASISLQKDIDKAKIYIINDCSSKNYESIIKDFSNLNIYEIDLDQNAGPGVARQIGFDCTNSDYVMFMDSDDQFYNQYNFKELYENISYYDLDMVYGREIEEDVQVNNNPIANIHGKIYKRKYLVDKNIRFNNTRYSEDHSFNKIALYSTKKVKLLESIVYVYTNNKNSTTHKGNEYKILLLYIYNMIYMTLEFEKRKISKTIIADNLIKGYVYVFWMVRENPKYGTDELYTKYYEFEELFSKYEKYSTKDFLKTRLSTVFNCGYYFFDTIYEEFNEFRNKFVRGEI